MEKIDPTCDSLELNLLESKYAALAWEESLKNGPDYQKYFDLMNEAGWIRALKSRGYVITLP